MIKFISEENYLLHFEYYKRMLLRISLLEREYPDLKGREMPEVLRLCRRHDEGDRIAELYSEAALHKVFFDSFGDGSYPPSRATRELFGSENALRDRIFKEAMRLSYGFVAVVVRRGRPEVTGSDSLRSITEVGEPVLALDVCEHAYYGDWGFNKEGYLLAALSCIRLSELDGRV